MKKIVIIEDEPIVANIYRNKLAVDGFGTELAKDADEGFKLIKSLHPDLVLLDLILPGMSGVDLLRKIRREPGLEELPVVVFTSTYLTNLIQEAWKAGATKCLSKATCSPEDIIEIVRSVLKLPASSHTFERHQFQPASPRNQKAIADGDLEGLFQTTLNECRTFFQRITSAENESGRLNAIWELCRGIQGLTGNAGLASTTHVVEMANALEALLRELYEKPDNLNASTLRTVASGIDFLGLLFGHACGPASRHRPRRILVVDDDQCSLRAVSFALEKARLKASGLSDPFEALERLQENQFDLVILDIDMPGMNGFELCGEIRSCRANKHTPVLFVTHLKDFESRAKSLSSGGNDTIGKPFLFIELAVKALMHIQRGQLDLS